MRPRSSPAGASTGRETRRPDNKQFTEKFAEVTHADVRGVEAWRMHIAWKERNNPLSVDDPSASFVGAMRFQ